jgi:hypothetical protein
LGPTILPQKGAKFERQELRSTPYKQEITSIQMGLLMPFLDLNKAYLNQTYKRQLIYLFQKQV